jgi:hypothetical protein
MVNSIGLDVTVAMDGPTAPFQLPGSVEIMKARKKPLIAQQRRCS